MSEEEKEAIEIIKSIININKENKSTTTMLYVSDVDVLLNLIEKLEKENEERKSEIEIFYKWLSFTCKELGISEDTPIIDMLSELKNNYIPKSKIKNLKEELNNFDISFYDKETLKEAVSNSLKELLEEE